MRAMYILVLLPALLIPACEGDDDDGITTPCFRVGVDGVEPAGPNAVSIIDGQIGFAAGGNSSFFPDEARDPQVLARTTDGINWAAIDQSPGSTFRTTPITDIQFLDVNNGFATRRPSPLNFESNDGSLFTTDGGANWRSFSSDEFGQWRGIQFLDASNGIRRGYSGGSSSAVPALDFTNDGGASWTKASLALTDLSADSDSTGVGEVVAHAYIDANNIRVLGYYRNRNFIAATTDGGANWSIVLDEGRSRQLLTDLQVLSTGEGWAVGAGFYRTTTDAGLTWTAEENSISNKTVLRMHFFDASSGFAIVRDQIEAAGTVGQFNNLTGQFYSTGDGGRTWNPTPLASVGPSNFEPGDDQRISYWSADGDLLF